MAAICEHCVARAKDNAAHDIRAQELLLEFLSGSPKTADEIVAADTGGCTACLIALTASLALAWVTMLAHRNGTQERTITALKLGLIEDLNGLV